MFDLIEPDSVYKKVETNSGSGQVIDGVYYPPTSTITYMSFEGTYEPFTEFDAKTFNLPSGIGSTDAIILYTDESLKIAKDLPSNSEDYDIIYLDDPESDSTAEAYKVQDKATWKSNKGFQLMAGTHYDYLLVRVENN